MQRGNAKSAHSFINVIFITNTTIERAVRGEKNKKASLSRRLSHREPAVGIEPTTARLRIECSTTELRWRMRWGTVPRSRYAFWQTCPGADSNRDALRHHPLKMACLPISPPGPCGRAPTVQLQLRAIRRSVWHVVPPSDSNRL